MTKRRSSKTKRHQLDGGFAPSQKRRKKTKRQSTNKDAAQHYAQASVPVTTLADAKTENGNEGATTDLHTPTDRWTESPKAKIAIATGAPDLVALRISGDDGRTALWALRRKNGNVPSTVAFRTDSSWTYLFKVRPDAVPDGEVRLTKGITLHGRGSHVIAPSRLDAPKSERHFVKGRAIREVDFAPAPDWLLVTNSSDAASPGEVPFHGFANIFPMLKDARLQELAGDIAEHGLLNAIWRYEGKILDGRCRYRACCLAGVEPRFEEYVGDDPLGFVIGQNLHRRHLNESQRAMVAAKIANLRLGDNQHSEGTSIDAASKTMNVSKSSVDRARKVLRHGDPKMTAAVESGKLKGSAAAARIGLSKSEERGRSEKPSIEKTSPAAVDDVNPSGTTPENVATGHPQPAPEHPESLPTIPREAEAYDLAIPTSLDRNVSAAVRAADRAEFTALMAAWDRATELKRVLPETSPAVLEQFIAFLRALLKKVGH